MSKQNFYAVAHGRQVGIFETWPICEQMVKGFPGAKYKKFGSKADASKFISENKKVNIEHVSDKLQELINKSKEKKVTARGIKRLSSLPDNNVLTKKPRIEEPEIITTSTPIRTSKNETILLPFEVDKEEFITAYTDGACWNNGQVGAVAGVGVWFGDDHPLNISKPVDGPKTNNTAEIQAARLAIELAHEIGLSKLKIKTDSNFLIKCATCWMPKWKKNGWKLTNGGDVKNRIELEKLDSAMENVNVKWKKVLAHSGIHGNEMADRLANQGAIKSS